MKQNNLLPQKSKQNLVSGGFSKKKKKKLWTMFFPSSSFAPAAVLIPDQAMYK